LKKINRNTITYPFKAKNRNNKTKILSAIAMLLMLSSIIPLTAAQTSAKQQQTDAYVSVTPNPVGVGQTVAVTFWISPYPPTALTDVHGFKVKITGPDGKSTTKGPYTAFKSSSSYLLYTPELVGTYTFDFTYPGESYFNGALAYLPSNASTSITVQSEPIPLWPETTPTGDYWTRPLAASNRLWFGVAGPWLGLVQGNEWCQNIKSPHIMWKTTIDIGGVAGGQMGISNFYEGSAYEAKGGSPIVIGGYLYLTGFLIGQRTSGGTKCFDLRTGEEVWYVSNMSIGFGWEMRIDSGNMHAIIPYLVQTGTTYRFYDPLSGRQLFELANASSPTVNVFSYDSKSLWPTTGDGTWPGTWFVYVASDSAAGARVILWNATRCFENIGWITYQSNNRVTDLATWAPPSSPGAVAGNWLRGVEWNVSSPAQWGYDKSRIPTDGNVTNWPKSYLAAYAADTDAGVLIATINANGIDNNAFAGWSMKTGALLWSKNITDVAYLSKYYTAGEGVYVIYSLIGSMYIGLNSLTGAELWRTPPLSGGGWSTYNNAPTIYQGRLFTMGYSGYVICNNLTTGEEIWATQIEPFNGETPYDGGNPMRAPPAFSQGVMYVTDQVKTDENPMRRNQGTAALDYNTGKVLWKLYIGPGGEGKRLAVSDGYLVTYAGFTSERLVLGKGPSKMTVSAPQTALKAGESVVITGTILDQSPALKDTPCIADRSMAEWMEYKFMQWPFPANATGVPVSLYATSPSGKTITIAEDLTSDTSGNYATMWTPDEVGLYKIDAAFKGTDAYGSSYATTYLGVAAASQSVVSPAPTQTAELTPTATSTPTSTASIAPQPKGGIDAYMYVGIAAVAIIVVIIAAAVILRRRK
jgi:outer membrane protein assembly factor BamB